MWGMEENVHYTLKFADTYDPSSYEDMIDHRSYARNLSSCEIKA